MKAGWEVTQLGEVCDVQNGGTPKSNVAEYWSDDVAWLTPKDMGKLETPYVSDTPRKISLAGLAKCSAKLVPVGSVIMSTRAPIGHLAINTTPMAFNQGCRGMTPNANLDLKYLYYFLHGNVEALNMLGTGATFKELGAGILKSFKIPIPPLEEQKRIVAVLDAAFEGLTRAKENAQTNLQNARELFESYLGDVFSTDQTNWTRTSVDALVKAGVLERPMDGNHGEIHPKKADFVECGVPFIMASDLMGGVVEQQSCNFISKKQADGLRKGFAIDGDILLSHKGTIGRTAILSTELDYVMLTPQVTFYRVLDQSQLSPEFLYFAFQSASFKREMGLAAGDGATRAYIGITKQLDLHLSYPSLTAQAHWIERFKYVEKETESAVREYTTKLTDIADLRQSLLQKAFAGELT